MEAGVDKLNKNRTRSAEETVRWLLRRLADFDYKYPKSIIAVCLVLFLLGVTYTASHLTFDADQANLIKRSTGLQSNQDRYVENFPRAEDLVVLVEDGTKEERQQYMESLAKRLQEEPETFSDIFYKVDTSCLRTYVLHYLDKDDLEKMAEGLENNRVLISRLLRSKNLVDIMEAANVGRTAIDPDSVGRLLPVVNGFVDIFYDCIMQRGRLHGKSPWSGALMGKELSDEERGMLDEVLTYGDMTSYSTVADGRFYILLCRPAYNDREPFEVSAQRSVVRMREILNELSRTHRHVFVGLTGEVVLNADEAEASSHDSINSALLSLFLISVVFSWAFRDYWRPLMAVFGLVMGLGWTMGFTTLAIGHLNLLTVTFTTILMGLGIDFGIHIIYRYDEERQKASSALEAMRVTLIGAGYENLTGAVSTALAFYVLAFTDFTGIAELGIIAGTGILLCLISMTLVLPSLIFLYEKKHRFETRSGNSKYRFVISAEQWLLKNNDAVVACGIAMTLICLWYGQYVRYDYNLLHLQAKGLESVAAERRLLSSSQHSLLCGISLAEDAEKACKLAEKFSQLPSVSDVETAAFMVPQDYQSKAENLRRIVKCARKLPPVYGKVVHDSDVSRIKEFLEMEAYFTQHSQDTDDFLKSLSQSEDKEVRE
ncbi:MMPL family transporter, partial [bacterium]|nr:MMPL family transporter [bacterium]